MRAGIVEYCEDYPYSTLRTVAKNASFSVPIHDRYGFKDEFALRWLNKKIDDVEMSELRKKLARSTLVDLKTKSRKKLNQENSALWLQKV